MAAASMAAPLSANDGNFQYSGARQKALSGAGVADGNDATSIALNPAGLVHSPDEVSISVTGLHPRRGYKGGDIDPFFPGFTVAPEGSHASNSEYFLIPNLAIARKVDGLPFADTIGFSVYGNGGLNTDYDSRLGSPACAFVPGAPGTGPFCFGKTGVNLQQLFVSLAFAKQLAPGLSVGVAPIVSRQQIEFEGFQLFSPQSSDPNNFTNKGTDVAWGFGARGGLEWAVTPQFRIGVAGSSRIYSEEFDQYRGAFAEQGDLDVPATVQAGIAVDVTPHLTFLLDYKRVFFSDVAAYNNPTTSTAQFGSDKGAGFGWSDIDVIKVGLEWDVDPSFTLRAGYSYNNDVVGSRDVLFNIISPSTTNHTVSGGFEYKYDRNWSVEFAGAYVPYDTLEGFEPDSPNSNPNHKVTLYLEQFEATLGVKYKFGEETASLK